MALSSSKFIGKSAERLLKERLSKLLADDPEAVKLVEELLRAFSERGQRGVRELILSLVSSHGSVKEAGG